MNAGARLWSYLTRDAFILATGVAAFWHSTWTLGTLFSGAIPDASTQPAASVAWHVPAMLLALAIDVGQISTAARIRSGERTWAIRFTFGTLALATYYLQFVYMSAHMPYIELAEGVQHTALPSALRNLALWIVPGLLPLSTILYTFSHRVDAHSAGGMQSHVYVYAEYDDCEIEVTKETHTLGNVERRKLPSKSGNGGMTAADLGISIVDLADGSYMPIDADGEALYVEDTGEARTYNTHRGANGAVARYIRTYQQENA